MSWTVGPEQDGQALGALLRGWLPEASYNALKRLVAGGRVRVDGVVEAGITRRLAAGARVEVGEAAARGGPGPAPRVRVVFEDSQVVVVDKPAGVSSVPYEPGERGTALDRVREHLARGRRAGGPLHVVHRIDKETSGLLMFARTREAERALAGQLRAHTIGRRYVCLAHGAVAGGRIESLLVADRGDGLRGSRPGAPDGKRAVTHVTPLEALPQAGPDGATLCEVRLETGRTHQIRVHLSEAGHPLVGDRVYTRDRLRAGQPLLPAPRLMLHAASLVFDHPARARRVTLEAPLPDDFQATLSALREGPR